MFWSPCRQHCQQVANAKCCVHLQACVLVLQVFLQPESHGTFWDSFSYLDVYNAPAPQQYWVSLYWWVGASFLPAAQEEVPAQGAAVTLAQSEAVPPPCIAHIQLPVVFTHRVITTTTSVGYGDVSPKNIAEQCLANLTMLLGMVLNGLLIGALANALTRASAVAHR
jgi:hypothetical protein